MCKASVAKLAERCNVSRMSDEQPFAALGARLKLARETRKMSIGELAELIGVKRQTVSFWENGKTEPGAAKLYAASKHLGASVEWFITGEGGGTGRAALMALSDEIKRKLDSIPA